MPFFFKTALTPGESLKLSTAKGLAGAGASASLSTLPGTAVSSLASEERGVSVFLTFLAYRRLAKIVETWGS